MPSNSKSAIKVITLIFLFLSTLSAKPGFYMEQTISVETSPLLIDYYNDITKTLCFDITKKTENSLEQFFLDDCKTNINWQGKISWFTVELHRSLLIPSFIWEFGQRTITISSDKHIATASMSKAQSYTGFAPIWQFSSKDIRKTGHLLLSPQIGVAHVNITGSTDENTNLKTLRYGIGLIVQSKLNTTQKEMKFFGFTAETGITIDHYLTGVRSFGRVYGEKIGLAYDRRVLYPKDIYLYYFNLGFVIKRIRRE